MASAHALQVGPKSRSKPPRVHFNALAFPYFQSKRESARVMPSAATEKPALTIGALIHVEDPMGPVGKMLFALPLPTRPFACVPLAGPDMPMSSASSVSAYSLALFQRVSWRSNVTTCLTSPFR